MPAALFITRAALAHLRTLPLSAQDGARASYRYLFAHPDELQDKAVEGHPHSRWWMFTASGRIYRMILDVERRAPNWIILSVVDAAEP